MFFASHVFRSKPTPTPISISMPKFVRSEWLNNWKFGIFRKSIEALKEKREGGREDEREWERGNLSTCLGRKNFLPLSLSLSLSLAFTHTLSLSVFHPNRSELANYLALSSFLTREHATFSDISVREKMSSVLECEQMCQYGRVRECEERECE